MSREFHVWRPHPWHGLATGPEPPRRVTAFLEMVPTDTVSYELDKRTGFLRVDWPQKSSSLPPCHYGMIPRTYCGARLQALCPASTQGDNDPLDICVLSERPIDRPEVILTARVVGGLQMVDHDESDDKILAVLEGDALWDDVEDVGGLPDGLIDRLQHYFLTYKLKPGEENRVSIEQVYGRGHAEKVVLAAMEDYREYLLGLEMST